MKQRFVAGAVVALAVPAIAVLGAGPALAAGAGSVEVTNTETVQAYLDATGKLDVARVYEQVAMQGKGTVQLSNPVETSGLRNLDGFGGFDVQKGKMVGAYEVDGERRLRSVSDYTKTMPLDVKVVYLLDGKKVTPGDVVGKSGRLEARYTVRNVTGKSQKVSFDDGTGATATAEEDVVIPMVGSLTTVLPSTFTDVASGEANIAGDGRGGTKLSFTMTLFGPIGSPEASFGYSAMITDGVVPKASISALPVTPLDSPSFKGGAASYKSGAETGVTLTAGATEIDANLLKLRDGAATLLGGLVTLRDGAKKLDAGLGSQILPGAGKLADGTGDLKDGTRRLRVGASDARDGSSRLSAGAGQLSAGAGQLDAGVGKLQGGTAKVNGGAGQLAAGLVAAGEKAPQLIDGLTLVSAGLDQLDAGLVQLYGGIGQLPKQAQPLHDGIAQLKAGIGAKGTADTLIDGVDQIRLGLAAATASGGPIDQLEGGVDQVIAGIGVANQPQTLLNGVALSKGGADQVQAGLEKALATGGSIAQLAGGIAQAQSADCGATCQAILGKVSAGVAQLRIETQAANDGLLQVSGGLGQVTTGLGGAKAGLGQVSAGLGQLKDQLSPAVVGLVKVECGLSNATLKGICDPKRPGLLEGLGTLDTGVTQLVNGVVGTVQGGVGGDKDTSADGTLRGGVHSLHGGIDQIGAGGVVLLDGLGQLSAGANTLKDGTSQLAAGTNELKAGSGKLSGGAGDLADGAGQLASGLGTLADGTGTLDDGAGALRDGAVKLAAGLGTAANGSAQLAAGLGTAADGAPALRDGAQRLSDEGTSKLVDAGQATAVDYGKKYAVIAAGGERAKTEGMAYGAPADAIGFTAYSIELAGADRETSQNTIRAVGALGLFALAGGLLFWRRRLS